MRPPKNRDTPHWHTCGTDMQIRIACRLSEMRMSNNQLATKMGIAQSQLYKWLRGECRLAEGNFNLLCDVLNLCE